MASLLNVIVAFITNRPNDFLINYVKLSSFEFLHKNRKFMSRLASLPERSHKSASLGTMHMKNMPHTFNGRHMNKINGMDFISLFFRSHKQCGKLFDSFQA